MSSAVSPGRSLCIYCFVLQTHVFDTGDLPSRWDSDRCSVPNTRRHFYTFADRPLKWEERGRCEQNLKQLAAKSSTLLPRHGCGNRDANKKTTRLCKKKVNDFKVFCWVENLVGKYIKYCINYYLTEKKYTSQTSQLFKWQQEEVLQPEVIISQRKCAVFLVSLDRISEKYLHCSSHLLLKRRSLVFCTKSQSVCRTCKRTNFALNWSSQAVIVPMLTLIHSELYQWQACDVSVCMSVKENRVTHVCCTSSPSILMHRSMCLVPHTCLCSCISAHKHLEHICLHLY